MSNFPLFLLLLLTNLNNLKGGRFRSQIFSCHPWNSFYLLALHDLIFGFLWQILSLYRKSGAVFFIRKILEKNLTTASCAKALKLRNGKRFWKVTE